MMITYNVGDKVCYDLGDWDIRTGEIAAVDFINEAWDVYVTDDGSVWNDNKWQICEEDILKHEPKPIEKEDITTWDKMSMENVHWRNGYEYALNMLHKARDEWVNENEE